MKTNQEQFLLAIARIEKFSPAPMILAKAIKLLRDPLADISSVSALVSNDPALAADILRCANSAFYNTGDPAQTIDQAVQRIGFRETFNLLNVAVSRVTSERDLSSYSISADDFWAESLFNGLFLRNLAKQTGKVDADEAYTVGLLRFIGRLAIDQVIQERGGGLFWLGAETVAKWENDSVGFVQAQAGAILLAKWHFPEEMVQAIAGQDAPAQLTKPNWMAEALEFASLLLPQGIGVPLHIALGEFIPTVSRIREFMAHSALSPEQAEAVLASTRCDCDLIRRNFGRNLKE